ncbi:MAG TPA: methyltransferase domain-containing protein [Candidatus Angelobacter sp.]|nr:methyltransferase domain-containing protein [Candidatus Angelobacter sp.]
MKRVVIPELLDSDAGTSREIEDSLADLRTINRYFGGVHTMTELLCDVASKRQLRKLSWLDVAGGNGELTHLASESLRSQGIEVQPVLLDRMPSHLNGRYPAVAGDALALPFQKNSFDVVGSCLFIHHLEPPNVVRFVNEALRVARHAVLINDLIRHRLHVALAYTGFALYRSRLTRHDSVASVRRAFTVDEIKAILQQTEAFKVEIKTFLPFRMGVIAWKRPSTT